MYFNLDYNGYKAVENAMKNFAETAHGEDTEWYHKSIRIPVGDNLTLEFHGPNVKARQAVTLGELDEQLPLPIPVTEEYLNETS